MSEAAVQMLRAEMNKMIQIGQVSDVDYVNKKVRVQLDGLKTAWIRWGVQRAGEDVTWWAPEVSEEVLVVVPFGNVSHAVVICALYSDAYQAPAETPNIRRTVYQDGTTVEYDREQHKMKVDCVGSVEVIGAENLTANFAGQIEINAPTTIINTEQTHNGNVVIDGNLVVLENLTVAKMATVGGLSSAGTYGGAGGTFAGDIKVQNGDVYADNYSMKMHYHFDSLGAPTSSARA